MRVNGQCPKCGSTEIYKNGRPGNRNYFIVSVFGGVRLDDFICGNCGYVETFLADMKDVEKDMRSTKNGEYRGGPDDANRLGREATRSRSEDKGPPAQEDFPEPLAAIAAQTTKLSGPPYP